MLKILIVDDSMFSRKIVSNLIKKFIGNFDDIEMFFACDGQEGFEKYKDINPDYIILDLLMPNLNGKELIKLIKRDNKDAKIAVISADVQKNVREEIESYGIMTFINKPFNQKKAEKLCNMMRND